MIKALLKILIPKCFISKSLKIFVFCWHLPVLTQLDGGVPEKISLVSRDEKSVLVVTYSDLKRCFDSTFQELQAAASGSL